YRRHDIPHRRKPDAPARRRGRDTRVAGPGSMKRLTHLDKSGAARMGDVSGKEKTPREATAEAVIVLAGAAFKAALSSNAKKGDVLAAARIAGIMAAKKTSE